MKTVSRTDPILEPYKDMLKTETHHSHEIIEDKHGTVRWKENGGVRAALENVALNDLIPLFHELGYDKNSELYRQLYRKLGYSLSGYWEVFYWEINNDEAGDYHQPLDSSWNSAIDAAIKQLKDCELVEPNVFRIRVHEAVGAVLGLKRM